MIIDERARVSMGRPVRKLLMLHRQEEGLWKGERRKTNKWRLKSNYFVMV